MLDYMKTPEQLAAEKAALKNAERLNRLNWFREQRNNLLAATDWTQLPDAPFSAAQKTAWQEYRQALRDLFTTADEEGWVVWPAEPRFDLTPPPPAEITNTPTVSPINFTPYVPPVSGA